MAEKIAIPEEYYEKFEERSTEKGFADADEYVNYVLGQIYERLRNDNEEYSEEEKEKVKEKLKGLGYMD